MISALIHRPIIPLPQQIYINTSDPLDFTADTSIFAAVTKLHNKLWARSLQYVSLVQPSG